MGHLVVLAKLAAQKLDEVDILLVPSLQLGSFLILLVDEFVEPLVTLSHVFKLHRMSLAQSPVLGPQLQVPLVLNDGLGPQPQHLILQLQHPVIVLKGL